MKSTVINCMAPKYPCLMVSDSGVVVLMDGHKTGMSLNDSPPHQRGEYRTDWAMEMFAPFYGSVTIES
jgi:hypothetical protein